MIIHLTIHYKIARYCSILVELLLYVCADPGSILGYGLCFLDSHFGEDSTYSFGHLIKSENEALKILVIDPFLFYNSW